MGGEATAKSIYRVVSCCGALHCSFAALTEFDE